MDNEHSQGSRFRAILQRVGKFVAAWFGCLSWDHIVGLFVSGDGKHFVCVKGKPISLAAIKGGVPVVEQ